MPFPVPSCDCSADRLIPSGPSAGWRGLDLCGRRIADGGARDRPGARAPSHEAGAGHLRAQCPWPGPVPNPGQDGLVVHADCLVYGAPGRRWFANAGGLLSAERQPRLPHTRRHRGADQPGAQSDRIDADGIVRAIAEGLQSAGLSPVGVVDVAPVRYNSIRMRIRLPGEPDALYRPVVPRSVSGGSSWSIGIPIVAGRSFDERSAERREVLVNEAFARSVWPNVKAVGATFVDSRKGESYTVIGVARDSHDTGLGDVPPVLYTAGMPNRSSNLLVRGSLEVTAARIQTIAAGIAPDIKMTVVPLRNYIEKELRIPMLGAAVAWGIGLLGLALALVGVFGVFAYVVEERRREIGVRLALGARAPEVVRLILAQTRIATLGGIAAGFVLSLGAGQLLRNYLFGVTRVDPIVYGGIATALALSAFLAAYLPARRAARIDPAVTLRCDECQRRAAGRHRVARGRRPRPQQDQSVQYRHAGGHARAGHRMDLQRPGPPNEPATGSIQQVDRG